VIDASLALYVHMPWCVRKCPYCDFNSHQLKSAQPDVSYIDALLRDFDMETPRVAGRRIDTVFFGGGTPSLFSPEEFARLLAALRERIAFAEDVEITLEANPGTIERGRFAGYAQAGINRVSLGAQSFDSRALAVLGRIHSADDTLRAVEELRAAKLDNFNLDLMYALPQQTPISFAHSTHTQYPWMVVPRALRANYDHHPRGTGAVVSPALFQGAGTTIPTNRFSCSSLVA